MIANRRMTVGMAALVVVGLACFGAPFFERLWNVDAYAIDARLIYGGPTARHLLGNDALGRDVLSRLLRGGAVSLIVAFAGTSVALVLGGLVGIVAGWFGGHVDRVLMRSTDVIVALPKLPLMMLLAAVPLPVDNLLKLTLVIVLLGWTSTARLARAAVLSVRETELVRATRVLGAGDLWILRQHVTPHVLPALLVAAAVDVGDLIVYESALSFLGLGVRPPDTSWGAMLAHGLTDLAARPLLVIAPGLAMLATVGAANLIADGLRDRLDPRIERRTRQTRSELG